MKKEKTEEQLLNIRISSMVLDLVQSKEAMISYLQYKLHEEDWHAVVNAAMDIRDIEAAKKALEEV